MKAESQEIANTLWAFATAAAFDKKLFNVMGHQAVRKLPSFKAQEAANVAWAFGRAKIVHTDLFTKLEEHLRLCQARTGLSDFAPQHLAMIIGACSQLYPVESTEDDEQAGNEAGEEK